MKQIFSTPLYNPDDYRADYHDHQDENEDVAEDSRMVDGTEYMSVAEWLRRYDPIQYPTVDALVSRSGVDRTYQTLGKMAAERGRLVGIEPVSLYHPSYGSVNGWPYHIIADAWSRFKFDYDITWRDRDPIVPTTPEPAQMPPVPYNPKLYAQIRESLAHRGKELPAAKDPRWRGAYTLLLEQRENETPQQALIRRQSATAVMYAIEMEYEKR